MTTSLPRAIDLRIGSQTESLNLDPLRLCLGLLGHGHVQDAVRQLCGDRIRIDRLWQRHRSGDLAVTPFIDQAGPLLFRRRTLGGDTERPLLERQIDALAADAWDVHLDVVRIAVLPDARRNEIRLDAASGCGTQELVN